MRIVSVIFNTVGGPVTFLRSLLAQRHPDRSGKKADAIKRAVNLSHVARLRSLSLATPRDFFPSFVYRELIVPLPRGRIAAARRRLRPRLRNPSDSAKRRDFAKCFSTHGVPSDFNRNARQGRIVKPPISPSAWQLGYRLNGASHYSLHQSSD